MSLLPKGSAVRIAALGTGLAVVLSISFSTQTYLAMINHGHAFWRILAWQLAGWVYWAAIAPWIVLRVCAGLGRDPVPRRAYAAPALAAAPVIAGHFAVERLLGSAPPWSNCFNSVALPAFTAAMTGESDGAHPTSKPANNSTNGFLVVVPTARRIAGALTFRHPALRQ